MNIAIYDEPTGVPLGGTEVYVAVLAEYLAAEHDVTILHHRKGLSAEELGGYAGVSLENVTFRYMADPPPYGQGLRSSWKRFRTRKFDEERETRGFDLFVSLSHQIPFFSSATLAVLIVLFPFYNPDAPPFSRDTRSRAQWWIRRLRQQLLHNVELRARLRRYEARAAISEFSRLWTKRRWKIDGSVLYPPVGTDKTVAPKSNRILSVGRFALERQGHGKKQMEMLETFASLKATHGGSWVYQCAGACGAAKDELAFLAQVRKEAAAIGAEVHANVERDRLRSLFRESKIFWHATGMEIDEDASPELLEHFGISTVEAMGAGCVPVVVNKGGQKEIVEHGVSGFLWNSVAEWRDYTTRLMKDEVLCAQMSEAARRRARMFSREAFVERFRGFVQPHLFRNNLPLEVASEPRLSAAV